MEKIVTNANFRVHNYAHACSILNRLKELNYPEGADWVHYNPGDNINYIYVDGEGKIYFNRNDVPEKVYNAMQGQKMTLDDLYAIVNMQSMPINDGEEQIEVYFDEKYIHLAGVNISFRELKRLHEIINK